MFRTESPSVHRRGPTDALCCQDLIPGVANQTVLLRHRGSDEPDRDVGAKSLVGVPQMLFDTDSPFFDGAPRIQELQGSGFAAAELRQIERENALQLLKR